MNKKMASLEAWMEVHYNEVHEETALVLQEITNQVAIV